MSVDRKSAGENSFEINTIDGKMVPVSAGVTGSLFKAEKQVERDGIEMGVLENGMPYLSESGLARMCGVARSTIQARAASWHSKKQTKVDDEIARLLNSKGFDSDQLFIQVEINGSRTNAYTEPVCMALLEFYAFGSGGPKAEALQACRKLLSISFRAMVYQAVNYHPQNTVIENLKRWGDRVDLTKNSVPFGYFCVFSEIASMMIPLIHAGFVVSDKVIPDISVGIAWANFWKDNNLSQKYGDRISYKHQYPSYYRQAVGGAKDAYAYPDEALGTFRRWLRANYIKTKFPDYIYRAMKKGAISTQAGTATLDAFSAVPELPNQ